MCGSTCLHVKYIDFKLVSRTRSQSSSASSTGPPTTPMPTLLCSTSMRPYAAMQASAMRAHSSARVTFAVTAVALPPSASIARLVSSAASLLRSTTSTDAPSRANRIAVALPLPMVSPGVWPPPTTIATLPFSLSAMQAGYQDAPAHATASFRVPPPRARARRSAHRRAVRTGHAVADRRRRQVLAGRRPDLDRALERRVVAGSRLALQAYGVRAGQELVAVVPGHVVVA